MVKVTDKNYYLGEKLAEKIKLSSQRCQNNLDAVLVVDGDEGFGKTTISFQIAYYASYLLGRNFDHTNVFFNLDKMIEFGKNNSKQVIVWDEAALGGLSEEWNSIAQKKLLKFVMIARKKNHFLVMNIPKFFKLREYLILDRAIGLVHVYSPDQITRGRLAYYTKKAKENLFYDWKRSKKRNYKLYYSFREVFTKFIPIDEEKYDKIKDEAIENFDKNDERELYVKYIQYKLSTVPGLTNDEIAEHCNRSERTIRSWKNHAKKHPDCLKFSKKQYY